MFKRGVIWLTFLLAVSWGCSDRPAGGGFPDGAADQRAPDLQRKDAAADLPAPDLPPPDQALPDLPPPPPDQALPDLPPPDQAPPLADQQSPPDLPPPDQAIPDQLAPDLPLPDLQAPDTAPPPDLPPPDQAIPDHAIPDQLAPDFPLPDLQAPDTAPPPDLSPKIITTTVTVDATANIYGAGHTTPPAPGGSGAGSLPTLVALPPGTGRVLLITAATGTIKYGSNIPANGPDGITPATACSLANQSGISGTTVPAGRFLAGVFIDNTEPQDPPPARLVLTSTAFTSLSPGLRQTFFLGDGLTGTGTGATQVFNIPDSATRLYMGVHDSSVCGGPVCCYGDNSGKFTLTLSLKIP